MKKMKNILYTLLAVSIIFAACKKEDEVVTPTVISGCTDVTATNYNSSATNDDGSCTYSIVGVWTPTSVDKDSSMTTTIAGDIIDVFDFGDGPEILSYSGSETMTPEEADMEGNLEFTSDGKMLVDGDEMDYTYSNNIVTVTGDDTTMAWPCSVTSTNLSLTIEASMDTAFTEPMLVMFGFANGDITISAYSGMTIHCSRSAVVNTNVSQRIGNTNHSWFIKPKFNNILKSIKK
jgi:hypothetical protein